MSVYKSFSEEQLENHFSQFLINAWSYSKTKSFARNQKAFEMEHIYGYAQKKSASNAAGTAYHKALSAYFTAWWSGEPLPDLITLTAIAHVHIEDIPANYWKLQKTTPTIELVIKKATELSTNLIQHFFEEISIYKDEIKEILSVESFQKEFVTVNGVDIPLPLSYVIDIAFRTNDGKVVVCDHKSKGVYTPESDMKITGGKQAVTYAIGFEATHGIKVDEVWFIENKYSKNKDKSNQLQKFVIDIQDSDTRIFYESMLYESVRAMILAVSDPDYVYLMNDSDSLSDLAELYEFYTKTLVAEVEEFNVPDNKKPLIEKRLRKIKDSGIKIVTPKVLKHFRENISQFIKYDYNSTDMTKDQKIEHVLRNFGIISKVAKVFDGYSSDTYLLEVSAGTKISSIHSYKLDIANALNVATVRISQNLVVHENESYLSIEVSKKRERDLIYNPDDLQDLKIPLGKDNMGNTIFWNIDNHSTPHMLVCGATGSGKSVGLLSTIEYAKKAGVKNIVVFDPKFEFSSMNLKGVEVYSDISDIESMMSLLVDEMNERTKSGVNSKCLIVFDEFADAQANARKGKQLDTFENVEVGCYANGRAKIERKKIGSDKSLEENLRVILQKGRSVGFRVISATQRASAKIITGDAKANFPVQWCFRLPKEIDSRVVLDEAGAESLAGYGDSLLKSPEYLDVKRIQSYYKKD